MRDRKAFHFHLYFSPVLASIQAVWYRRMQLFIMTLPKYKVYAASKSRFLSLPLSHFSMAKFQQKKPKANVLRSAFKWVIF